MIIQFDRKITRANPQLFAYVEAKSIWYPVYYVLDRRVRQSVNLQSWLKEQVDNPSDALKVACNAITSDSEADYTMTNILRWVQEKIVYRPDNAVWRVSEKWQTAEETLRLGTGDCEDGAILMYLMAVYMGVPSERLLLFAGDVDGGGHCWLGYRSSEYPLNWCFLDWCYWYDRRTPSARTKYFIKDTKILNDPNNQYYNIWFAFNHKTSFKGINNATA